MAASDMVCVKKELLERLMDWLLALHTEKRKKNIIKSPQDCEHTEIIRFWVKEYAFVQRLSNMFSFKITTFTLFSYIKRRCLDTEKF